MKYLILSLALLASSTTQAETIIHMMERAHFLETAKGRSDEALRIYRTIATAKPTDETRDTILQALVKIEAYETYKLRKESTLQHKLDRFVMHPTPDLRVIDILGIPDTNETYGLNKKRLGYSAGYTVNVGWNYLAISFNKPVYNLQGITVGSTEEELTAVFLPQKTGLYDRDKHIKEGVRYLTDATLYDMKGKPGQKWYRISKNLTFTLKDGVVESFSMTLDSLHAE